jgi:hypothetical protein
MVRVAEFVSTGEAEFAVLSVVVLIALTDGEAAALAEAGELPVIDGNQLEALGDGISGDAVNLNGPDLGASDFNGWHSVLQRTSPLDFNERNTREPA